MIVLMDATENQIFGCHLEDFKRKDLMILICITPMFCLILLEISEKHTVKYTCKI